MRVQCPPKYISINSWEVSKTFSLSEFIKDLKIHVFLGQSSGDTLSHNNYKHRQTVSLLLLYIKLEIETLF